MLYRCVAIDEVDRGAGCKRGKRCTVFTPTYLLIWRAVTSAPAYFPPPAPAPLLNFQYEGNRKRYFVKYGNRTVTSQTATTMTNHHAAKNVTSTGLDGVHGTSNQPLCAVRAGVGLRL